MTIVIYAHRYKRPPRKRKAVALEVPVVVVAKGRPGKPIDRAEPKQPPAPQPQPATVVVSISRKRARLLRWGAEEPREPSPEVAAFFARNVRPGGPRSPRKP